MYRDLKFTVIIPTRQRADVLGPALRTVVSQDYDNLEILVSDNFSGDQTAEVVRGFDDPRIRYVNTGRRLSMSHNWEFALSHVSDGWVTILGDDDGLMPGALNRAAELIGEYRTSMLRSSIGSYIWPSLTQSPFGRLTVGLQRGCELRRSKDWLMRLAHGTVSYASLPTLYTGGFAEYRLIERARDQAGSFYRSMVPDVYSAVALAKLTEHYVYCHEQLAMGGGSGHSTGASHFAGARPDTADAAPAAAYYSEANIPFHPSLAAESDGKPPPSIQLLVYESLLQSGHLGVIDDPVVQPARQLEIILRNAKRRHRAELAEWGAGFARLHDLSFDGVRREAGRIRYGEKLVKNTRKLVEQLTSVNVDGSVTLPLKDVYEATIAAATINLVGSRGPGAWMRSLLPGAS